MYNINVIINGHCINYDGIIAGNAIQAAIMVTNRYNIETAKMYVYDDRTGGLEIFDVISGIVY